MRRQPACAVHGASLLLLLLNSNRCAARHILRSPRKPAPPSPQPTQASTPLTTTHASQHPHLCLHLLCQLVPPPHADRRGRSAQRVAPRARAAACGSGHSVCGICGSMSLTPCIAQAMHHACSNNSARRPAQHQHQHQRQDRSSRRLDPPARSPAAQLLLSPSVSSSSGMYLSRRPAASLPGSSSRPCSGRMCWGEGEGGREGGA